MALRVVLCGSTGGTGGTCKGVYTRQLHRTQRTCCEGEVGSSRRAAAAVAIAFGIAGCHPRLALAAEESAVMGGVHDAGIHRTVSGADGRSLRFVNEGYSGGEWYAGGGVPGAPRIESPVGGVERSKAVQGSTLQAGEIDYRKLGVGLGLTIASALGGTLALENSGILPAIKAANEQSRRMENEMEEENEITAGNSSQDFSPNVDKEVVGDNEEEESLQKAVEDGLRSAAEAYEAKKRTPADLKEE